MATLLPQKPPSCVFDKSNMASTSAAGPPAQPSSATAPGAASTPLLATGDWTRSLIQLAKTAELKYVPVVGRRQTRADGCACPLLLDMFHFPMRHIHVWRRLDVSPCCCTAFDR